MRQIISYRTLVTVALLVSVSASALGQIWVQHQIRGYFAALQQSEARVDALSTEWMQLSLEEATWTGSGHLEHVALAQLQLRAPDPRRIVLVSRDPT